MSDLERPYLRKRERNNTLAVILSRVGHGFLRFAQRLNNNMPISDSIYSRNIEGSFIEINELKKLLLKPKGSSSMENYPVMQAYIACINNVIINYTYDPRVIEWASEFNINSSDTFYRIKKFPELPIKETLKKFYSDIYANITGSLLALVELSPEQEIVLQDRARDFQLEYQDRFKYCIENRNPYLS